MWRRRIVTAHCKYAEASRGIPAVLREKSVEILRQSQCCWLIQLLNLIAYYTHIDRETFVPAVIQALDYITRLASLSLIADEEDERAEKRIRAKAAARK